MTNICLFHLSFAYLEREIQVFFRKTVSSFVKTANQVSKLIFWRSFFWKKFFIHHWALIEFFLSFVLTSVDWAVSTAFCLSIATNCGEIVCVKIFFSHPFRILIASLSVFAQNIFNQVDDTAFYESKRSIWGQKTVLTNICLFHLSFAYLERESQGFFQKTVSSFVKTANNVSKMIFWRSFFRKSFFFIIGLWASFFVICTNFCRSGRQYCFPFVNCTSLWCNSLCQKIFSPIIFAYWSQIYRSFFDLFFGQVDNTAFYESKGSIWGHKTVMTNICLFHLSFAYLERESQGFYQKTVSSFDKTANHVSKMIFWRSFFRKSFFFIIGLWASFFVLCTNFCRSGRQYCFPFVNGTSLCFNSLCQKIFSPIIFAYWSQIYRSFFDFFFGQVDNTAFYESKGSIWGHKTVMTNICSFHLSFAYLEREIQSFFRKTVSSFVKTANHVSKLIFGRSFLWKNFFYSSLGFDRVFLSFVLTSVDWAVSTAFCLSIAPNCGEILCVKIFFSHPFRILIASLSVFAQNIFNQVDDTAFYESKRSIWGQKTVLTNICLFHLSFAYLERESQGFHQKTVSSFVKTANHVSKMIFWRSFFSEKFFFHYWALSDFFCHLY